LIPKLLKDNNVRFIDVPKKMTHAFQPADMLIICNIKKHAQEAWKKFVQGLFAKFETNEAIKQMYSGCMPVVRARKYAFLSEAITKATSATVVRSWEQAGLSKYVFGDSNEVTCVFDEMQKQADKTPDADQARMFIVDLV
jgi:hypothetical protein